MYMNILSIGYKSVEMETETQHYILQDASTTCTYGSARYKLSLAASNYYHLSDEFTKHVCNLPETYDQDTYIAFIDTWGTVRMYLSSNVLA